MSIFYQQGQRAALVKLGFIEAYGPDTREGQRKSMGLGALVGGSLGALGGGLRGVGKGPAGGKGAIAGGLMGMGIGAGTAGLAKHLLNRQARKDYDRNLQPINEALHEKEMARSKEIDEADPIGYEVDWEVDDQVPRAYQPHFYSAKTPEEIEEPYRDIWSKHRGIMDKLEPIHDKWDALTEPDYLKKREARDAYQARVNKLF